MGFFSDLFEGNFGNLWHDITADPVAEIGLGTAAVLGTGGLLAPELLGAGAAGGLGGLFGAGEAAAGGTGLAASALGGAELGGTAAGVDISSLLASGAAGGAGAAGAGSDTALALTAPEASPTASAGLPSEITTGTSAGAPGANDPLVEQILGEAKSGVASLPDASGGGGSIFNNLVSGAGNQIAKNPIGLAAGGAGLVGSLLQGTKSSGPAQDALKAEAPVLQQQGNQLQSYLSAGTLPPALQAQLDQQIQAAKARIIANHAAQGRSTDPAQNSALAQELNNVDLQATALKGQTETQLYEQGRQDIQLSADLNKTLANFDRQDQQAVSQALMNFAKAMTPGAGAVQLKLG